MAQSGRPSESDCCIDGIARRGILGAPIDYHAPRTETWPRSNCGAKTVNTETVTRPYDCKSRVPGVLPPNFSARFRLGYHRNHFWATGVWSLMMETQGAKRKDVERMGLSRPTSVALGFCFQIFQLPPTPNSHHKHNFASRQRTRTVKRSCCAFVDIGYSITLKVLHPYFLRSHLSVFSRRDP